MAYEGSLRTIPGQIASADLSAKQFYFVDIGASGAAVIGTEGIAADGVLQNKPAAAGRAATIASGGVSKVVAGAAITKGAHVMSSSAGKAITATSGKTILGTALEAAGADGDIIAVNLDIDGVEP